MKNNSSPIVKWMFSIVAVIMAGINAALTFSFGYAYFGPAFGSSFMADYLAGFYALLIMDVAYLTWFWVYLSGSNGRYQRSLSFLMASVSLVASILATVNQLVVGGFNLVDLSQYQDGVGTASLVSMVVLTAAHIISFAGFILFDPLQRVKTEAADSLSDVLEDAIQEAKTLVARDKDQLVADMSHQMREQVLLSLGYSRELKRIGNSETIVESLPEPRETAVNKPAMPEPHYVSYSANGQSNGLNFTNGRR